MEFTTYTLNFPYTCLYIYIYQGCSSHQNIWGVIEVSWGSGGHFELNVFDNGYCNRV